MHTSKLALFGFAFVLASQGLASAQEVAWTTKYSEGRTQAQSLERPLVVLVGSPADQQKLSADPAVRKLLTQHSVPLFLDSKDVAHQGVIRELGITSGSGFVISNRAATHQTYFHDGAVTPDRVFGPLAALSAGEAIRSATPQIATSSQSSAGIVQAGYSYSSPAATITPATYFQPQAAPSGASYIPSYSYGAGYYQPSAPSYAPSFGGSRNC